MIQLTLSLSAALVPSLKVCTVLLITGVIGNSLIILQVIINKYMRNPTFIVICGLAASDLIMVSVRLTKEITDVLGKTINTTILCKLQLFLLQVSAYSAAYHLVLLSVIRYFFLVHPFQAEKYLTNKNVCET
ncbi:C-C chemokine receptor type 8-like [Patella vulgata]|uniref:C-C chemokine receptor type 8-like n=1 Tax=Patella vulgata TaxID=6465 RepID=UPI00217FDAC4|nr:C-C chemokine receptor type 8-like [Patella vulgata]